jgi:toxin-antitoxin system PIN domain toxin
MKPYLLDTNVLIALAWPNHIHHRDAVGWFQRRGSKAFRTCPLTQTGFIRISSNPSFTPNAANPGEAVALLKRLMALLGHDFWPDDVSVTDAFGSDRTVVTHRHVADGYLLALAAAHDGVLATLDSGIAALARGCPQQLELLAS